MARKVGVVRFLGTNCDRDIWQAVEAAGDQPEWLWYQDQFDCKQYDAVILPGGFSYGDYLRSGALAAKSAVMNSVAEAAKSGVPVLGICNGFQILCEAGLLPGVLVRNEHCRFVDKWVDLHLRKSCPSWAQDKDSHCRLPVAHGDGCFYIDPEGLKRIQDQEQVWWQYQQNPNGSVFDIAGVMNEQGNVAGLMPHPERALFEWMGNDHGLSFFKEGAS